MPITSIKGTSDILPPQVYLWQKIEKKAQEVFESFGFSEIRTPIFEDTSLFVKSIGDSTDIVQKEMYSFKDRGDRDITLRPEGTASIVRAYVEHGLNYSEGLCKFYYLGPMFRAERPQKGRSRQFHQIGLESIGSTSPYIDAESIFAMVSFFKEIGLSGYEIKLNSIGCKEDKKVFGNSLKKYLEPQRSKLCDECKIRLEKNVLRILDCKAESCKALVKDSPKISDNLCKTCKEHLDAVKENLEKLRIPFKIVQNLVRGLDYYTGTVFEVTHKNLGAQDALAAGGRYDNLVKDFGGPQVGAFGFAIGTERLFISLGQEDNGKGIDIFIAPVGEKSTDEGFRILNDLRNAVIKSSDKKVVTSEMDFEERSLNAKMRRANKRCAKFVLILNDSDLNLKKCVLRDMGKKSQEEIPLDKAVDCILAKF